MDTTFEHFGGEVADCCSGLSIRGRMERLRKSLMSSSVTQSSTVERSNSFASGSKAKISFGRSRPVWRKLCSCYFYFSVCPRSDANIRTDGFVGNYRFYVCVTDD